MTCGTVRVLSAGAAVQNMLIAAHAYPDRRVELHFLRCELRGEPSPQLGQETRYHDSTRASGEMPVSSGLKSSTYGSSTGRSFSGTGTVPHFSQ